MSRRLQGQGTCCWLPYDWRLPTWARLKERLWNPGGPMFSPKVFGWGFTLNFAHKDTWIILGALVLSALVANLVSLG